MLDALGLLSEIMDAQVLELIEMRATSDLYEIDDKLERHGERLTVLEQPVVLDTTSVLH